MSGSLVMRFSLSAQGSLSENGSLKGSKGPGKRGRIVADTLLPTQMFPRLPARATFVADTNFVPGTQKMFLILFRNILCPQQMFPSLRSPRNIMGNNVFATMRPRLPGPLGERYLKNLESYKCLM